MSRWQSRMVVLLMVLVYFPLAVSAGAALFAEEPPGKVEIMIRDSKYEYHARILRPQVSSVIVLRNVDSIVHGFTSSFLEDLDVRVEAEGATTFGKGIKGVHIPPGQTVRIHFVPMRAGNFSFQCDLHPSMKGELILLSVEAA